MCIDVMLVVFLVAVLSAGLQAPKSNASKDRIGGYGH